MTDWTTISDSQIDPNAPVTSELMAALRDNPSAIAEGATGATRIAVDAFSGSVAGDTLLFSAYGPDVEVTSTTDLTIFEGARFKAVTSGTIRVSFEYKRSGDTLNVTAGVYKNGSVVLTQTKNSTSYSTHTVDISFVAGDVINVFGQGSKSGELSAVAVLRNIEYRTGAIRLLGGI